jgi:hypothetical protein
VGRRVVYTPNYGDPEYGKIIRVSRSTVFAFVFVLYDGDTTPKATSPHLLEFALTEPADRSDACRGTGEFTRPEHGSCDTVDCACPCHSLLAW